MARFILIRLMQTIVTLFVIITLVFFLGRASGGDPTIQPTTLTEEGAKEFRAKLAKMWGLDKPKSGQYMVFVKKLAEGDQETSYFWERTVSEMIVEALPCTLILSISTFIVSMSLSVIFGILAATRRGTIIDIGIKFIVILAQAMPVFWISIMAILLFSVHWNLISLSSSGGIGRYVLAVAVLTIYILPGTLRIVRSSMLDVLDSEYIKLARIKGVPERSVILKHTLRNALIAPITMSGMLLGALITGVVIIETIFNLPGIGWLSIQAFLSRDYPVMQGVVLITSAVILLINFIVDILYAFIDPQIRYQRNLA